MRVGIAYGDDVANAIEVADVATAQSLFPGALIVEDERVSFGWKRVNGVWGPPPAPSPPSMSDERQAAFERAMAFGKKIEQAILGRYTAGEPLTWETQETEAKIVAAGGTLDADAILPGLAADRGMTVEALATIVLQKATFFKQVIRAGQRLRRAAEGLLSPTLDTPEALAAAVEALRQAAAQEATALGLPLPQ